MARPRRHAAGGGRGGRHLRRPRRRTRHTARHFRRFPRPSQGILTGTPTTGLLVVWISPRTPEQTAALRDWGDFVHIRHIAAAAIPGFTHVTPYENSRARRPPLHALLRARRRRPRGRLPGHGRGTWRTYFGGSRTEAFRGVGRLGGGRRPGRLLQHLPPAGSVARPARAPWHAGGSAERHVLRPRRQAAPARHAHHPQPARAHERHGLRRHDPLPSRRWRPRAPTTTPAWWSSPGRAGRSAREPTSRTPASSPTSPA